MLKKLSLTLISFFLLSNALYAQTNEDQLIDEMVSQVDTEELRLIVEQLSGARPLYDGSSIVTRRVGTEGNKKAADFIAEQYSNIGNLDIMTDGFNPIRTGEFEKLLFLLIVAPTADDEVVKATIDSFNMGIDLLKKINIRRCKNILATLRGESRQFVFATAHYDSLVWNLDGTEIMEDAFAPGADDNSTGVAATIMAAKILSQYSFTNSICFMNPDLEELMFYGSTSYVLQHLFGLKRIKSVINIDMIGYDHDSDGIMNVPYGSNSMKDVVSNEYNKLELNIAPVFLSVDALNSQSEYTFLASDHFPFYTMGVSNVLSFNEGWWLSETEYGDNENNIAYHTEEDTVDNINFAYMTEIVKLYVATLAREAGVIGRR